jgi:hypothetical protein
MSNNNLTAEQIVEAATQIVIDLAKYHKDYPPGMYSPGSPAHTVNIEIEKRAVAWVAALPQTSMSAQHTGQPQEAVCKFPDCDCPDHLEDRSAEGTWSNPTATLHAKECKYPPKEEAVSEGTVDAEKDAYQELFNYFHREHDILLLESDMQEVIRIVQSKPAEAVTDEAIRDAVHEAFWGWVADKEKGADERLKEKIVSIVLAGRKHSATQGEQEYVPILSKGYTCKLCGVVVSDGEFHDCELPDKEDYQFKILLNENKRLSDEYWKLYGILVKESNRKKEFYEQLQEAQSRIASLEGEQKWISAETPPKESGRYWCYVRELNDLGVARYQWNCYYDKEVNQWREKSMGAGDQVTHWQPLPSPPSPKDSKTGPGEDYEKKYGGPWER